MSPSSPTALPAQSLGVTAHLPVRGSVAEWKRVSATLAKLPRCTLREDLLFWEVSWTPGVLDTTNLAKRLEVVAKSGHRLVLNVVPHPHPTSQPWQQILARYPKTVEWTTWHRPPYPLWEPIQSTLQKQIDWVVDFWQRAGRRPDDLAFEWINEPATGFVSGGPPTEPQGLWSQAFHAFCNHLLLSDGGVRFRGHLLLGPTVSFWNTADQERIGFASVEGGSGAKWWTRIDRLSMNSAVYLPWKVLKDPEKIAAQTFEETARRLGRLQRLDLPASSRPIGLHEWYVTRETLGVSEALDPQLRAECIESIGKKLRTHPDLGAIYFYCLFGRSASPKSIEAATGFRRYEHACESGPALRALITFLSP